METPREHHVATERAGYPVTGHEVPHETAQERHARPATRVLLRELAGEASALVRAEVALAKTEMRENVTEVKRGVASLVTGGAVLAAGLLALVAFAILILAVVMPAWVAALIIGGGLAIAGAIMLAAGKSKVEPSALKPDRSMASLRRDKDFAHHEAGRAKEALR